MVPNSFTTKIMAVDPKGLVMLERNARYMRHEQFNRLVSNIRRDGRLTSVPLVALMEDGRYEVLSGNHRTAAAIEAGLGEIEVMAIDEPLTEQQRVALQLSHNAIAGEDDPSMLKALYDGLDDVDWREYTGLDDKQLELLADVQVGSLSEANLTFTTLTLVFLPEELDRLRKVIDEAMTLAKSDQTWVARYSTHDRLLDALADVGKSYDVLNVATGLDIILDMFDVHKGEIVDGWWDENDQTVKHKKWVPLAPVTGYNVPAETLAVIRKAVEKAKGGDNGMAGWQALAVMAEQFLAASKK